MIVDKKNYSIDCFTNAFIVETDNDKLGSMRSAHLDHSLNFVSEDGEFLEFGVYKAGSTNQIAKRFPHKTIHGFDSFEGLPEDWVTRKREVKWPDKIKHIKGKFALDNLPPVESNVKLWKGWFDQTLPKYIKAVNPSKVSFLHVDGDLYSSAKTVLEGLNDYIVKGTVIVFDEMYPWGRKPYDFWYEHEYKALQEWTETYDRKFEVISRNNHQQCCIKII